MPRVRPPPSRRWGGTGRTPGPPASRPAPSPAASPPPASRGGWSCAPTAPPRRPYSARPRARRSCARPRTPVRRSGSPPSLLAVSAPHQRVSVPWPGTGWRGCLPAATAPARARSPAPRFAAPPRPAPPARAAVACRSRCRPHAPPGAPSAHPPAPTRGARSGRRRSAPPAPAGRPRTPVLLDEHLRRRRAHRAPSRVLGVAQVQRWAVVLRQRRRQAALRPVARGLRQRRGRHQRHPRALPGGAQRRIQSRGAGAHHRDVHLQIHAPPRRLHASPPASALSGPIAHLTMPVLISRIIFSSGF